MAGDAPYDTRAVRNAGVTPREEQVLRHIALGLSNDEIARSLDIIIETVKEHVQKILRTLAGIPMLKNLGPTGAVRGKS